MLFDEMVKLLKPYIRANKPTKLTMYDPKLRVGKDKYEMLLIVRRAKKPFVPDRWWDK
jgi:hypothetical protein